MEMSALFTGIDTLKLFTINTWFEPHHTNDRMILLAREIERLNPDIIAFQEVTQDMYEIFSKHAWFGGYKCRSWPKSDARYFTMMFTRDESKYQRIDFPDTRMGRDLLISYPLADSDIAVATFHLESTIEETHRRENQLGFTFKTMEDLDGGSISTSIIMGDTNITAFDGNVCIPYPWIDVWEYLHAGDQGWTRDSSNPNSPNVEHSRLDRVFLKSDKWSPKTIEIVADKVHPDFPNLLPSDHYGLFCVLQRKKMSIVRTDENKPLFSCPSDFIGKTQVEPNELTPQLISNIINAFSGMVDAFKRDPSMLLISSFKSEIAKIRPVDIRLRLRFNAIIENLCEIYMKAIVDRAFGADYAIEQEIEWLVDVWRMSHNIPRSNTATESAWGELMRGLLDIVNETVWNEPPEIANQPARSRLLLPQTVNDFAAALLGTAESFVLGQTAVAQQDKGPMVDIWGDDDADGEDIG